MVCTIRPTGTQDSLLTDVLEARLVHTAPTVVTMEGVGSMAPQEVFRQGRQLLRHPQQVYHHGSEAGNV